MKGRLVLLATVALLAVILFASGIASANNSGDLPHDGGCAAYCARAVIHIQDDGGAWLPLDDDKDGKVETCLRELVGGQQCIKNAGACPEADGDGDGVMDRCVLPKDDMGFWCRLMHGSDTHGGAH